MREAIARGPARKEGFWDGVMGMRRVLIANYLRETRARFGEGRFAYLRALVLQMATVAIFYFIRGSIGGQAAIQVDLLTLLMLGFFPFLLAKGVMSNAAQALDANRALLFYPGVRPLDFVLSVAMLQGMTIVLAFGIALTINYQFVPAPRPADSLKLLLCLAASWLLGLGLGGLQMSVQTLWPNLRFALQLMTKPLLFISGVMYAATEIPLGLVRILWWNPFFHLTEMAREGISSSYKSPLYDGTYLGFWILISLAAALTLERYLRRNLRSV